MECVLPMVANARLLKNTLNKLFSTNGAGPQNVKIRSEMGEKGKRLRNPCFESCSWFWFLCSPLVFLSNDCRGHFEMCKWISAHAFCQGWQLMVDNSLADQRNMCMSVNISCCNSQISKIRVSYGFLKPMQWIKPGGSLLLILSLFRNFAASHISISLRRRSWGTLH